jgi:hypothetical protein
LIDSSNRERIVTFHWKSPDDLLAVTHGGQVPVDLIPPGIASLTGTDIADHLLVMAKVRDETGAIGTLIEIEVGLQDFNREWEVYLLVVIPGRGALAAREKGGPSAVNARLQSAIQQAQNSGEWTGDIAQIGTAGPLPNGYGEVTMATGEFEGTTGRQQQTCRWRRITPSLHVTENTETFWLTRNVARHDPR